MTTIISPRVECWVTYHFIDSFSAAATGDGSNTRESIYNKPEPSFGVLDLFTFIHFETPFLNIIITIDSNHFTSYYYNKDFLQTLVQPLAYDHDQDCPDTNFIIPIFRQTERKNQFIFRTERNRQTRRQQPMKFVFASYKSKLDASFLLRRANP